MYADTALRSQRHPHQLTNPKLARKLPAYVFNDFGDDAVP